MEITTLSIVLLAIIIALLFFIYIRCYSKFSKTICMNYANGQNSELSVALVKEMVNGYKTHQLSYIKQSMEDDAHSLWFDIETLKRFIYHLEMDTRTNNQTVKSEKLGLRIYFARYPDKRTWSTIYKKDLSILLGNPVTEKYENLHTLVMVPTIKIGEDNVDFNPKDIRTYRTGLYGLKKNAVSSDKGSSDATDTEAATMYKSSDLEMDGDSPDSISALNHGSLIPPGRRTGERF